MFLFLFQPLFIARLDWYASVSGEGGPRGNARSPRWQRASSVSSIVTSFDVFLLQVVVTIGFYACVSLLGAGCQDAESALCGGLGFMEYAIRSLILLSTVVAINFNISHIRLCIQVGGHGPGRVGVARRLGVYARLFFVVVGDVNHLPRVITS